MMQRLAAALCLTMLLASTAAAEEKNNHLIERWSPMREEIDMARPQAMGRVCVGIAEGHTAGLCNPAGLPQAKLYSIATDIEVDAHFQYNAVSASVVDSITSGVAAQLGYTYNGYDSKQFWSGPDGAYDFQWLNSGIQSYSSPYYYRENLQPETNYRYDQNGVPYALNGVNPDTPVTDFRRMFGRYKDGFVHRHIPRLSLAGAIGEFFMLGTTVKYVYAQRPGRWNVNAATADIGLLVKTGVGLNIGLTGYNLIPVPYDLWPVKLGAGVSYSIPKTFYVGYDQIVRFDTISEKEPSSGSTTYPHGTHLAYRGGIEYWAGGVAPLRLGYEYDSYIKNHIVSGGLGYSDDKFSIGFAYSQGLVDQAEKLLGLSVDFKI
ncbi:MAG: hypothetical protein C4523_01640 [Myxococcales bacterium]|nr:MAG: hypothetical protein C4523_01640 [Myxococcales bacterium]